MWFCLKYIWTGGITSKMEPFSYAREPHHCSVYCPAKLMAALRGHKEMYCSVSAPFIA
jgi:hypothetical protein